MFLATVSNCFAPETSAVLFQQDGSKCRNISFQSGLCLIRTELRMSLGAGSVDGCRGRFGELVVIQVGVGAAESVRLELAERQTYS